MIYLFILWNILHNLYVGWLARENQLLKEGNIDLDIFKD